MIKNYQDADLEVCICARYRPVEAGPVGACSGSLLGSAMHTRTYVGCGVCCIGSAGCGVQHAACCEGGSVCNRTIARGILVCVVSMDLANPLCRDSYKLVVDVAVPIENRIQSHARRNPAMSWLQLEHNN